jgi:hypothetical protein
MKPGRKTTEFAAMIGAQVIGLLVLLGIIEPGAGDVATTAVAEAIEHVSALLTMGAAVVAYINSRGKAKAPPAQLPPLPPPVFVPEPIASVHDLERRS